MARHISHAVEEIQIRFIREPTGEQFGVAMIDRGDGQWSWLADVSFGPFDTDYDLGRWVTRTLGLAVRPRRL